MAGHATPAECLAELDRLEADTGRRWSMSLRRADGLYYPFDDGGHLRDLACNTKRLYTSRSRAKKSLKELKRQGRLSLVEYECRYSRNGPHYHLGHLPGEQTYLRSGGIYG